MNILIIGNGGREHALTYFIAKSPLCDKIYAIPGNPGIFSIANETGIDKLNFEDITVFCIEKKIDLVIIGPEKPLSDGLSDILRTNGVNVFGPSQKAARIESSKAFAKEFMKKYNIPTANYAVFNKNQLNEAIEYIKGHNHPLVLKADGLAAGKGVIITHSVEESIEIANSMFAGLFGAASETIVIEQFLNGDEASILAITDGNNYVTLAPSQDHKKIFDGDQGPNTGGMGAYAPTDLITDSMLEKIKTKILTPAIKGLQNEGTPFVGCLYAGLMISNGEPYVVEFNARFGDPETQAVLMVFEGDLLKLLYSAATGQLDKSCISNIANSYACCVVVASEGYPANYKTGFPIFGLDEIKNEDIIIFHSGTSIQKNQIVTAGGRVLCVCAKGSSLQNSIEKAYFAVEKIFFENIYYRRDIGKKGLNYLSQ